ncbi:MDR family MFS transporter [Bifidobacterium bombi]|uniref:MFS superfamily transporter n=1 Tax=Bifidobacterium bombi DSM 19703 TaxID=1341695 RepID=A0A080N222_9BIFI|nr:MDR family MFS transporter [Bifidobacterium bombi]KFF30963.1 MFS superfamily transporter [Bifidobacterium bombi DSM 19703]
MQRRLLKNTKHNLSVPLQQGETYADGHLTHAAFVSIAILTFITFLGNFTQLQLSAALPTIVDEFHISVTTGQWLTSVIQLVQGVMVPLTAYLTRRFSTRQIVITSMSIFTIGSLLAWQSHVFAFVLLGRTLEAVGSGVMWPVLQITVFSIYPLAKRGLAMGTVGMAMSVAPAIGPTFGGWQTDATGWRSIFLTLSISGVIALLLAIFGLHNFNEKDKMAKADFFSVCLSVIGFGGLLYGFTNIESYPFTNPMVWLMMLVGLGGIVWFIVRQMKGARRFNAARSELLELRRHNAAGNARIRPIEDWDDQPVVNRHFGRRKMHEGTYAEELKEVQPPLLDLTVLRNRNFMIGTLVAALSFFAFSSINVILPLYIQSDRGYAATISGLVMLPGALGQCISQFGGGRLLDKFGARPTALFGSIILFIGTVMMSFIGSGTVIWWVSICQFIRQVGMGFVLMPCTTWSLNCLEPKDVSAGSAVTNTIRQVSGAIGSPVLVILMEQFTTLKERTLGTSHAAAITSSIFGVRISLYVSSVIAFMMVATVFLGVRGKGAGSTKDMTQKAINAMHRRLFSASH